MLEKELLYKKIKRLPDKFIPDVFSYILFLESRDESNSFTKSAQAVSEKSFAKVWDNDEDAVYDKF